jgi:RTX calcium-binding nonapeptide repeat (4 copies)
MPKKINGTNNADRIEGTDGDDLIVAKGGNDLIFAGDGNDTIYTGSVKGADHLSSTAFPGGNLVEAGDGDDTVFGSEISDRIYGGPGDDFLDGGGLFNSLYGEGGNDTLIAYDFNLALGDSEEFGDPFGNDTIIFTPADPNASASLNGGRGDDLYVLHAFTPNVFIFDTGDHDTIDASRITAPIDLQLFDIGNIEVFDFTGGPGSELRLDPQSVNDMDMRDSTIDGLTVRGDAADRIDVSAFTLTGTDQGFDVYEADGARVLVDPDMALLG